MGGTCNTHGRNEKRTGPTTSVGKPEGEELFAKARAVLEGNIKVNLK